MNAIIELGIVRLSAAYIFIVFLVFFVRSRKIKREKEIITATVRMTIQLILVGYILIYVFDNKHPLFTILIILIMEFFAIHNIFKRVPLKLSKEIKKTIAFSMVTGNFITILFFLFIVINLKPWYEPRYFIPIAGMIIGNSMTGISLGVFKLVDGFKSSKNKIEGALMLGATPKKAASEIVNGAFDAAILPVINSMVGMGIVFLPGMMTGQILAGVNPVTSIQYQIAIMLAIAGSVALTVIIFVLNAYKTFFNKNAQLI